MTKIFVTKELPYRERMAKIKEGRRKPAIVLNVLNEGPSSRGSTYWNRVASCPREHYLANHLGWASTKWNDPLDWGLVWHRMLEVYYIEKGKAQRAHASWVPISKEMCRIQDVDFFRAGEPEARMAAMSVLAFFEKEEGYADMYKRMMNMFQDYVNEAQFDRWQVVDVEFVIDKEMPTSLGTFCYSTKIDLGVIDHADSMPYFKPVEHKSTYQINEDVKKGYSFHPQVLGQAFLCKVGIDQEALPPMMGHLVNLQSKTKDQDAKMYLREVMPVYATDDQLIFWWKHHLRMITWLNEDPKAGYYSPNLHQCSRKFGLCEFFDLCSTGLDFRLDEPPDGFTQVDYYKRKGT